jgi:hypothetical protein
VRRSDPLAIRSELPLAGRFYPLGFPLDLATNSPDVLQAARESWGDRAAAFDTPPLDIRVLVEPDGPLCDAAAHRKHGHLYAIVSDAANFAHLDLDRQLAFARISAKTAADHSWFRWFFLEAMAYIMLTQRRVAMVHAGCVARDGAGVLLCGPSEAGKSTLSYAAARSGWTWIADDCVSLLIGAPGRIALGQSRRARLRIDAPALFPELECMMARARPTGKVGIEIDMSQIPGASVASQAPVAAIAFIERRGGRPAMEPIGEDEAIERLLADMPSYGGETDVLHEQTVRRLASLPAHRLMYENIEDGVRLLSAL